MARGKSNNGRQTKATKNIKHMPVNADNPTGGTVSDVAEAVIAANTSASKKISIKEKTKANGDEKNIRNMFSGGENAIANGVLTNSICTSAKDVAANVDCPMTFAKYTCYVCSIHLEDLNSAIEHLKSCAKNKVTFRCMKNQIAPNLVCKSGFKSLKTLKEHMKKKCVLCFNDVRDNAIPESNLLSEFSELCIDESTPDEDKTCEENATCHENFAALFETTIDKLNTFKLHHNVYNEVLIMMKELLSQSNEINKQLIRNNPEENVEFVLDSTNDYVSSQIDKFGTRYKRDLQIAKSPYFVAPEAESQPQNGAFYYVPILKTVKSLFLNENFRKKYFEYNKNHKCKDGVYERYCCGDNFKKNNLFQSNPNAIQIQIFFDDFQLTAPLKTKTIKVCGMYFIIHNFPPEFVSQLQNMYLISLCDSTFILNNGCNAILKRLVSDLKSLETKGISIDDELVLKGTLVQVSCDNLGGNTIFGFTKCFNAFYYCRICYCKRDKCRTHTKEIASKLRTKEQYNVKMDEIDSLSNLKRKVDVEKTLGYVNYCALNDLEHFHTIDNRTQDVMHDIFEGAGPFTLRSLFKYFLTHDILTKNEIAEKILLFDYGTLESQNIPSPVFFNKANLNQNASQMRCLIKHIPFIFVDLLQLKCEKKKKLVHNVWRVVEQLLKIIQIISSTVIKEADLVSLEKHTAEFLKCIQTIFATHLIPKMHFLTHYSNTIKAMGPIIKLQMFRGDAKHQTFTRYADRTNNFINICKTLSETHQKEMASNLEQNKFSNRIKTNKKISKLVDGRGNLMEEFKNESKLFTNFFKDMNKVIIKNRLFVNSFCFQKGLFVISSSKIYKIDAILECDGSFSFLCTQFRPVKFHKFANCVEIRQCTEISLIKFSELMFKNSYEGKDLNGQTQIIAEDLETLTIYEELL